MARLGFGVQSERRERLDFGLRYADGYDVGVIACRLSEVSICLQPQASSVLDYYASASLLVKLGNLPAPVVAQVVAPPAPTCDTLDGDNDYDSSSNIPHPLANPDDRKCLIYSHRNNAGDCRNLRQTESSN